MTLPRRPMLAMPPPRNAHRELPAGSELMIAITLGLAGWWGIAHAVMWIAGP